MSIYIRGMEMPRERESFQVTIKYNGIVLDTETGIQVAEAYEVPPHGRLIDADALKASLVFAEETAEWAVPALRAVLMVIDEMPTIIGAEEGE